jgi:DNA damage-inducible protein 1
MAIALQLKQELQNNPAMLQQLVNQDPKLADAVLSDDLNQLTALVTEREKIRRGRESEQFRKIQQLNSDPFNPYYKKKIAEAIRQEQVNENMESAIEFNPEGIIFGKGKH